MSDLGRDPQTGHHQRRRLMVTASCLWTADCIRIWSRRRRFLILPDSMAARDGDLGLHAEFPDLDFWGCRYPPSNAVVKMKEELLPEKTGPTTMADHEDDGGALAIDSPVGFEEYETVVVGSIQK
ncbi:hypothetical protein ACLOJK_023502 [Asimina triloba]